jgi:small subunit ribosomal protein S4e
LYQLTFHDGRTYLTKDNNYKVGDTVVFDLNEKKPLELIKPEVGGKCIVTSGRHAGVVGVLKEVREVGERRKEAVLETKEGEIRTLYRYLFFLPEWWSA